MEHLGLCGQVPESTIVRMHDRRVPVTLNMLYKANAARDTSNEKQKWEEPTEIWHLQDAVLNYHMILWSIWPSDYAAFPIQKVLIESKWGEAAGNNNKQRVQLVRKFFEEVVKQNSGRAVRDEPPLSYEEVKQTWIRSMESMFPHLSMLTLNPARTGAQPTGKGNNAAGHQNKKVKTSSSSTNKQGRPRPSTGKRLRIFTIIVQNLQ